MLELLIVRSDQLLRSPCCPAQSLDLGSCHSSCLEVRGALLCILKSSLSSAIPRCSIRSPAARLGLWPNALPPYIWGFRLKRTSTVPCALQDTTF